MRSYAVATERRSEVSSVAGGVFGEADRRSSSMESAVRASPVERETMDWRRVEVRCGKEGKEGKEGVLEDSVED